MANASAILASLEDQVTCHVCLEVFEDPRELLCRHTLCCACYTKMHADNKGLVTCPLCRADCLSAPGDLPVDMKVLAIVNTYNSLKTQQELSTCTSGGGEHKKRKCLIPGCTKNSVNVGPFCRLELCSEHYEEDEKKMVNMCEKALASLSTRIGENGNMKVKLSWLKRQVGRLQEEKEEVGAVFRELEKTLRLKREQLEAELETRIKTLESLLEFIQELFSLLENQDAKLKGAFQKHDYVSASDAVKQVEKILDSVSIKEKVTKIASVHVPIQKMLTFINQALKKCSVVDMPVFEEEEISVPLATQQFQYALDKKTYKVEEKKSIELKKVNSVFYCNNTAGLFHDSSKYEPSYENLSGCVVRSTKTSEKLRPLPNEILIVQCNDCKYNRDYNCSEILLVYSVDGELISLISMSKYLSFCRSYRGLSILACDSVTQTLFIKHGDRELLQISLSKDDEYYGHSGLKCNYVSSASVCSKFNLELKASEGLHKYCRLAVLERESSNSRLILATATVTTSNSQWSQKLQYEINEDKNLNLQLECTSVHLDMYKVYLLQKTADQKYEIVVLSTDTLERLACVDLIGNDVERISHLMNEFFLVFSRNGKVSIFNCFSSKSVTLEMFDEKKKYLGSKRSHSVFFPNSSGAYVIVWVDPYHDNKGIDIYKISCNDDSATNLQQPTAEVKI